ncbi:MAG TPA: DUF6259 domain-containing protein, partial [Phototrophicaceae bacterium]|nr:DUF6259 domain-containing protein [Phototrophicaceae bacterium]
GGHDTNYPDFIPPDPRWGSTQDFADLVSEIHQRGGLAIPYTNFSWWNLNSPTLSALPSGTKLKDLVVSDVSGLPDLETYGPKSGVVVDLNNAFVQSRIAQQHDTLLNDVGVDGIFEDQFGNRDAPYDYNPSGLGNYDPSTTYYAGVVNHFRDQAGSHLMTELGIDVLAQFATGFMGSNYLWDMEGYRTTAAYTSYYPMAGMLLRDKVLLYQHNLAAQTWTSNIDMLRWNLTQGYGLSNAVFDETLPGLNMANPWLNLVGVFQKYALANYADQLVQSFDDLGNDVTRTKFSTYTVYANWSTDMSYTQDNNTLPPGGVVTRANDGSVIAGVFTAFNGQPLSDGDHDLVEVRSADEIRIFQPVGSDTTIHIPGWSKATVTAYQYDGTEIADVDTTISGTDVSFAYQGTLQGQQVGYYSITPQ